MCQKRSSCSKHALKYVDIHGHLLLTRRGMMLGVWSQLTKAQLLARPAPVKADKGMTRRTTDRLHAGGSANHRQPRSAASMQRLPRRM
jgi:hypothetical protein